MSLIQAIYRERIGQFLCIGSDDISESYIHGDLLPYGVKVSKYLYPDAMVLTVNRDFVGDNAGAVESNGIFRILYFRDALCIAALDLRNKPWINEKLSAQPASHLPPTGKPSAGHLPAN